MRSSFERKTETSAASHRGVLDREQRAAAKRAGVTDRIGHVSTGGGASLELLAGKTLPGVAALEGA